MAADTPSYSKHYDRDLKRIDPSWEFEWDRGSGRWRVIKRAKIIGLDGKTIIHWVQEQDGSYRPIDDRALFHLRKQAFLSRNPRYAEMIARYDKEQEEKQRQQDRDDLKDSIDENRYWLRGRSVWSYGK